MSADGPFVPQDFLTEDSEPIQHIEPFSFAVQRWVCENEPKILQCHALKGGWEPWAQVELALYLQQRLFKIGAEVITVTREESAYEGNRDRVDIMVKNARAGTHLIELKTESQYNFAGFADSVRKDFGKIEETKTIKEAFLTKQAATLYSIVLSVSDEGHEAMAELGLYELNPATEAVQCKQVRVWWYRKEIT